MHIQAVRMCTYEVRKAKKQAIYDAKAAAKAEAEASSEGGGRRRGGRVNSLPHRKQGCVVVLSQKIYIGAFLSLVFKLKFECLNVRFIEDK